MFEFALPTPVKQIFFTIIANKIPLSPATYHNNVSVLLYHFLLSVNKICVADSFHWKQGVFDVEMCNHYAIIYTDIRLLLYVLYIHATEEGQ